MTLKHAGTCMLSVTKPCWSGLTSRRHRDKWQLSIFTAWSRSSSFLSRVLLSTSLPFAADFPGHQTKVKNKTMLSGETRTCRRTHTFPLRIWKCHLLPGDGRLPWTRATRRLWPDAMATAGQPRASACLRPPGGNLIVALLIATADLCCPAGK